MTALDEILAPGETYRLRYTGPGFTERLRTMSLAALLGIFGVMLPVVVLFGLYLVVSPSSDEPLHAAGIVAGLVIVWVIGETLFYFLLWRGRSRVVVEYGRVFVHRGGIRDERLVLAPDEKVNAPETAEMRILRFSDEQYDLEISCGPETATAILGRPA